MLENEKARVYQEQANVIQKAKQEADTYVRRIKREANEAIEELKDLLKEKAQPPKWHEVEKKSKKIKELRVILATEEDEQSEQVIKAGDYVLVKSINQSGYVLEGPNVQGDVVVQIGSVKLTVDKEQILPGKLVEEKKTPHHRNESFLDKAIHISPEIDLRGKYAEDALTDLDRYLEDANLAGLSKVQVIHGKGTGALRAAVRNYLKGHRYIKDFRDGLREEGGHGVTVINFK